ncbi:MAG: NAD(P)-dependent oxidoreductase [Ignavibacteria bacterium]|jgi:dTDP-4-dehydrorhamnose reductase|nr:NAD(P)-dependent oxidoreductase [Ignavibacteria bacterium]MCU7503625.1 NAD(P)-dependent oxidoreductase [Ignavibacteria bacterium]MCU7517892.1 NAD(P)-dependent oxidoreductase [Ignavibacteria bacterium]
MPALKVLITGGSGLLGQYLNKELSRNFEILTLYNRNEGNCKGFNSARVNILDTNGLRAAFKAFCPDVVVHTAAVANSAKAEKMAWSDVLAINVEGTRNIARLSEECNSRLIYTSTDLVYDGSLGMMLKEDAELNPRSLYAETKLLSEEAIKNITGSYLILRTSLLYGMGLNHSDCHFQRMYESLKKGEEVRVFYDQFRSPLSLFNAAEIISCLVEKGFTGEIINLGGSERISRYGLGSILCEEAGLDKSFLKAISMDEVEASAVKDVSMDTGKLRQLPGIEQKSIRQSVREIVDREKEKS